jgi:hypothetical protein
MGAYHGKTLAALIAGQKYPVSQISIPVIRKFFPVIFLRELTEKSLRHSGFWLQTWLQKA